MVCDKLPSQDSGFTLSVNCLSLAPAEYCDVEILWSPDKEGGARETIHWKTSAGVRAQTVIFANCVNPAFKKVCGLKTK